MTSPYIPFVAFLVLLLLLFSFSFDFATTAVPGFHSTIFPPYFIWVLVVLVILVFLIIGYWLLVKLANKIDWALFTIHFILTILTIIFLIFPSVLLDVERPNQEEVGNAMRFRLKLIPAAWSLFIVGQILFIIYYFRTINPNRFEK